MGLPIRFYLFAENGDLRRIPQRVSAAMCHDNDALPEFAGTRQRVAQVVIENENSKPVRILDVRGSYWHFDDKGQIGKALSETVGEFLELDYVSRKKPATAGKVVDLVPEIKKKDLHDRHRWTVTNDDLDRIAADVWPGVHGPAPDVTVVKGKAPKRPPLSYEAKHSVREIGDRLEIIKHHLSSLSEHALKGFEFEALRTATYEDPGPMAGRR